MSYENKVDLPVRYWIANNDLHRAYYEWDRIPRNSPREWMPQSIVVNSTDYNLAGSRDVITDNLEEWLIEETGINKEWYESHRNTYGLDGLVKKFKKQCAAFSFIEVIEYYGEFYSVRTPDEITGAFIYIPKSNKNYQIFKTIGVEKATENARFNLFWELNLLQDWLNGKVFSLVRETYNRELGEWEETERINDVYIGSDEEAEEEIINNFGDFKELEEDRVFRRINTNSLDVLFGQKLLGIA